jgi:hypothetical protein
MKTASASSQKFAERAANSASDYVKESQATTKDQSANAIAAKEIYKQALTASFGKDAYAKGLGKSGKAGWLKGVTEKGADRFAGGVMNAAAKYAANSAPFDSARAASASMPRGVKGSPQNLAKVAAVVTALRAAKG